MKKFIKHIATVILFSLLVFQTHAQINDLKKQKEKLEKEISFTKDKISDLKQKRSSSLNELIALKKQISTREELIQNINQQIQLLNKQIDGSKSLIRALNNDIEKLKKEYAKMIYQTYVNHNPYNNLMFVFASSTFNEAFQRMEYLKEYSNYRVKQAELIKNTKLALESEVQEMEEKKKEKIALKKDQVEHQITLSEEQKEINNQIVGLKEKEAQYLKIVRKKEKDAQKINAQIQKMIAEATKKARKKESNSNIPVLTPEALALSKSFSTNKGKLPWPVERGTIVQGFGKKPHPVLKGVYTNNNGIDIMTTNTAEVRAIFDGEVMNTFYHPIFHRGVIVMHGEFFTVYLNLKEVYVHEGETVKTKQKIGKVFNDKDDNSAEVHLEIWKGTTLLNPSLWLYK
jgi:murein hydrolase activator